MMPSGSSGEPEERDQETALLVAARTDAAAFGRFYDLTSDSVAAFFYRRTSCAHTAAELTAETFAQALSALKRYRPELAPARPWLFGIAGNLYRQWLRHGRLRKRTWHRLGIRLPTLTEDDLEHIESLVDFGPLRDALQSALRELTPTVRDAVLLRVALDMPYVDVADRLGCSVGAARVRVARGLAQLTSDLEQLR